MKKSKKRLRRKNPTRIHEALKAKGYVNWAPTRKEIDRVVNCLDEAGFAFWGLSWYQNRAKTKFLTNVTLLRSKSDVRLSGTGKTKAGAIRNACAKIRRKGKRKTKIKRAR